MVRISRAFKGFIALVALWVEGSLIGLAIWTGAALFNSYDPFELSSMWGRVEWPDVPGSTYLPLLLLGFLIAAFRRIRVNWIGNTARSKLMSRLHLLIFCFCILLVGYWGTVAAVSYLWSGSVPSPAIAAYCTTAMIAALVSRHLMIAYWYPPAEAVVERDKRPAILYLRSFRNETRFGYLRQILSFVSRTAMPMLGHALRIMRAAMKNDEAAEKRAFDDMHRSFRLALAKSVVPRTAYRGFLTKLKALVAGRQHGDEQAVLGDYLSTLGPFIAIEQPKHDNYWSEIGASRFKGGEDWQILIAKAAQSAAAIIIDAGKTPGLSWEIQHILEHIPPRKVLLMTPLVDRDYFAFLDALGHLFPHSLPREHRNFRFIAFKEDWSPMPIRINVPDLLEDAFDSAGDLDLSGGLTPIDTVLAPFVNRAGIEFSPPPVHLADTLFSVIKGKLMVYFDEPSMFVHNASANNRAVDFERLAVYSFERSAEKFAAALAEIGTPAAHEYYITFNSNGRGVVYGKHIFEARSEDEAFEEELTTFILQNNFWAPQSRGGLFEVTVQFKTGYERAIIPLADIVEFGDATAGIMMQRPGRLSAKLAEASPTVEMAAASVDETIGQIHIATSNGASI